MQEIYNKPCKLWDGIYTKSQAWPLIAHLLLLCQNFLHQNSLSLTCPRVEVKMVIWWWNQGDHYLHYHDFSWAIGLMDPHPSPSQPTISLMTQTQEHVKMWWRFNSWLLSSFPLPEQPQNCNLAFVFYIYINISIWANFHIP